MADVSSFSNHSHYLPNPPRTYPSPPPHDHDKQLPERPNSETRNTPPTPTIRLQRKPVPAPAVLLGSGTLADAPSASVQVERGAWPAEHQSFSAQIEDHGSQISAPSSRSTSENFPGQHLTPPPDPSRLSPAVQQLPVRTHPGPSSLDQSTVTHRRFPSGDSLTGTSRNQSDPRLTPTSSGNRSSQNSLDQPIDDSESYQPLHYFHQGLEQRRASGTARRASPANRASWMDSRLSSGSELVDRGRGLSPAGTPESYARARSTHSMGRSPEMRPMSYVDLLNVPYPQAPPVSADALDKSHLRNAVGNNASLLSTTKTLEMYRANVKKTNDAAIQYEFAVFMISCAQEAGLEASQSSDKPIEVNPAELLKEARQILQKLADRSYPFAQYYLADGFASGLFNRGKEDYDRAFPLFIAAAKHGHAEAGYRAGLCYEFGWGTRADAGKAVQFYRQSASKNHPGAMLRLGRACLTGDLGLVKRYREGVKWLKRAAESADFQYNSAPYELGVLHETGCGDDIFQDESYAAQLFTKSADLGHPEANYRLGDAYEHGRLACPKDPALSVHFYTGAAQRGHPLAMMALCAWYMVGAEPVLEKDENEAYEWAKRAAEQCMFISFSPLPLFSFPAITNIILISTSSPPKSRVLRRLLHRNRHRLPPRPP